MKSIAFISVAFCLLFTIIQSVYGQQQPTGFVLMHVRNPEKPAENGVDVCVNFQANEERPLPEQPFHLVWWDLRFNNTAICQRQLTTPVPRLDRNEILPIQYETVPMRFRQLCRLLPQFKYTEDPIKYQIDIATNAGAQALLFFVDRRTENINGTHDYLHSHFCNGAISFQQGNNDTQGQQNQNTTTTNVFFIYRHAFDQFVVPKLRETPNAELRFRLPAEPGFDFSSILLWLLLISGVAFGSLWSARAARERHEGKSSGRSPEGIELRGPGERAADRDGGGEHNSKRSPLHLFCYVFALLVGIVVYVTLLARWHALILAIAWTVLGTFCMSKCLFALFKYIVFPYRRGEQRVLLTFRDYHLTPLGIFCYLIGAAICLPWFFWRHHPYAFLPLDLINMAILVFFIKYFTFEPLLAGYTLKHQIIYSTIIFLIALLFATWKFVHPLKVDCSPVAPVDTGEQHLAAFIVPKFNDPLSACWDPRVELGFQPAAISLLPIIFSAFFVPFWFFIDMINGKKVYFYGILAFVGFALGWWLFLIWLGAALHLDLAWDATPFGLVLPLPVWFGTLCSLVQHTTRKLWNGQLQF